MLKKILTLSLVAVMLSTAVLATEFMELTSVHAAEEVAETFDTTITASTEPNPMEFLWVTQSETDGVVSQKIATISWTASAKTFTDDKWVLAKIDVGENLVFDSMMFSTWINMKATTTTVYCIPLAKADFDAAKAISGNSEASLNNLVKPGADVTGVVTGKNSATSTASKAIELDLVPEQFNGESNYYQDGCIYLAFWATNASGNAKCAVKDSRAKWKLAISGTIVEPAVTDFSDAVITWENGAYTVTTGTASGTAMLIAASFNGNTMVDAKVAKIDAATAVDGVISGNITDLEAGTSVKVFLWNPTTLAPAIGVSNF